MIAASRGSNDLVAAAFVACGLAVLYRAARSSAMLTVAGWIKLIPFFLLPFVAARFRSRDLRRAVAAFAAAMIAVTAWVLVLGGSNGLDRMMDGVSFQAERGALLSIWTLIGFEPRRSSSRRPCYRSSPYRLCS